MRLSKAVTAFARLAVLAGVTVTLVAALGCTKKTPREQLDEISRYLEKRDYFAASIKAKDLIKKYPDSEECFNAMMILAQCYFHERDFEMTHATLQQAIDKYGMASPRGFTAFSLRLDTMKFEGKTTEAVEVATKALDSYSSDTEPYTYLRATIGDYNLEIGRSDEGRAVLNDLAARTKDPKIVLNLIEKIVGSYMAKQEFDLAAKVYENYLKEHPDTEFKRLLLVGIADLLSKGGHQKEAQAKFEEAFALFRKEIDKAQSADAKGQLVQEMTRAYYLKGDYDSAIRINKDFADNYRTSAMYPQAVFNLASCYEQKGDYDAAAALMDQLSSKFADQPFAQQASMYAAQLRQEKSAKTAAATATVAEARTTGSVSAVAAVADARSTGSAPATAMTSGTTAGHGQ